MSVPGRFIYLLAAGSCALMPQPVWAMPPGMEESIADVMVWVVVVAVPLAALYLFWKVHVLPEVFAERHHHPQKRAIQVLCLLSLAFGGLLWPLAWLWAFTKPTAYKAAYGTDKHDDYFLKPDGAHGGKPLDLAIVDDEIVALREKLQQLSQKRALIQAAQQQNAAVSKESDRA
ncbi:DUF3302 domain-containing protein [Chromobacterium amazonense]|uniref:DUF3302 domain-containing protein n=2 Tax=Chromobacterium amazonense TaxID=1382803 RepID=A0A2S9X6K8_9NEIS|nr:DUF3302 domain-containing protein [Chromobacterium amazonense]MBM2884500.1 DUF3302 domain-containing protein [Chromobacterium amazonense]MDQ4539190.1 DUF3302 domain-containing protein [Chromobacterium amazonense]PRP71317.1 hypothetical protein BUE93_07575 [Chromobacterium amazonense]